MTMTQEFWNDRNTATVVRWVNATANPTEAACAVAAAMFGLLAHHDADDIAKALASHLHDVAHNPAAIDEGVRP
jgi:gamma-glutamylcysteine synthetase